MNNPIPALALLAALSACAALPKPEGCRPSASPILDKPADQITTAKEYVDSVSGVTVKVTCKF